MKNQSKSSLWQVIRFGFVGVLAVGLYYRILYTLTEFLHVWYLLSAIIAYVFNIISNFILHKYWTFKHKDKQKVRKQIFWYFVLCTSFFIINTASLYILVEIVHLYYLHAQIILTVILSIASYFLTKRIFAN